MSDRRQHLLLACASGSQVEVSTDLKRVYVNAGATMTVEEARILGSALTEAGDQVARGFGLRRPGA
jgi:hypothetical protein